MKKRILALSIIFVIIANMFGFDTNVKAATEIAITGNTVWRSNETTATINFISDTAGTAYYKITENSTSPADIVTGGTDGGSVTANTTKSISLTGLTSGAKYVHIVVKNGDSLSNVLTIEMPYDYYYNEDFESYNESTYISSGNLSPIEQVNNGTGDANQKVVSQVENNILLLNSASSWASDQVVKLDSTKLSAAYKYVLEGRVYVPIDTTGWRARFGFTNGAYGGTDKEVGVHFKNNCIVYNGDDSSSILLANYEANKWYNIKIEVSPSTSKYNIYIDGVLKGNELPLLASNVNRIAFTSGHGYTALYDDFKFYAMSASTPATNMVTFNTNGGGTVASQTVANGGTATLPTEPTKSNYTFGGWYSDEELTTPFDFATAITAPTTIYAKWNSIQIPILTGNSVWRSNGTTANINFISDTAGTAYYKITENSTSPVDIVTGGTDGGSVTANTTKSISLTGLTSGAKYVHIVVKNGDNLSNVLTIALPYDVYYFDDFESYSENQYPGFFYMKHNGGSASNQKIITLNEDKVFNAYGTFATGLDERIQIEPLSTGYAVFETDISAASLTNSWYFGGIVIGPNYDNNNRNICVQVNPNSIKFVSGENSGNHTSNIIFEANKNYHVKMVLDVTNHKLDYYINNVKANDDPINIAASYYTDLNWFGIYNGAGTVYYDNMSFYVTDTAPISTYKVTFNTNGGSTVANQTITSGETATEPTEPTKADYTFGGWYADEELTTPFEFTAAITAATTIYAKWNPILYTVTFNTNEGSTVTNQTITNGGIATEPTEPTKANYTFGGWYANEELTTPFDFTTAITAATTIYAKWNPIPTYTVTFDRGTTEGADIAPKTLKDGEAYGTLEVPTRTGYSFDGWFTSATGGVKVEAETKSALSANQILYAHWSAIKVTVAYDKNGGSSVSMTNAIYTYDTLFGLLPTTSKTGYVLDGWYTAKTGGNKITAESAVKFTADTTLYAQWKAATYKVSFDANGGKVTTSSKTVSYAGTYGTLPSATRSGYSFAGWYTAKTGGTKVTSSTAVKITKAITLYARYSYKVSFDKNGGKVSTTSKTVYCQQKYGTLPKATRSGYVFAGWYTKKTGGSLITDKSTVGSTKVSKLYARWAKSYTVKFDKNGGKSVTKSSMSVGYGLKYGTLPTAKRAGYTFSGWYTAKKGGSKITASSVVKIKKTTTLYARWSKVSVSKANIKSLTSKSKNMAVTLSKVSGAKGYEITYATNTKFTTGKKTVSVTTVTKNITSLVKGKRYYVRVRAYKLDSMGKKVYGAYSAVKNIKVK